MASRPTDLRSVAPPRSHPGDFDLAQRVRRRDGEALREFASQMDCVPRFLSVLNQRVGAGLGSDELADLAQDAVVLVLRSLDRYEGRASLQTWAWHVCRGALMNGLRSRERQPNVSSLDFEAASPERQMLIESEVLNQALLDLGPPSEDVIRLKLEDGLAFHEIGDRLQIPTNTAKTQYYRGLR